MSAMHQRDSRRTFTVTVEPVAACNLACGYCYAATDDASAPDPEPLLGALDRIARHAAARGRDTLDCVWLGGEPLLAGVAFFREVAAWTGRAASRIGIRHFLQTNGLLLDEAFCRLFREADIRVGLSLDGPRDLHDAFRRAPDGAPTFDRVMDAVALLRDQAVPFGCVAVVTGRTLGREREVYDFFCGLGSGLRINPVIPGPGVAAAAARLAPEDYGRSLVRFFDAWNTPRPDRVNLSPLDNYLLSLLDGQPRECQQKPSCVGEGLGLKPNGDLVRCGRFQDHVLGNLATAADPQTLLAAANDDPLRDRATGLAGCRSCPDQPICHGGCPHNALAFARDLEARDPLCPAYKMIFSHIRKTLHL